MSKDRSAVVVWIAILAAKLSGEECVAPAGIHYELGFIGSCPSCSVFSLNQMCGILAKLDVLGPDALMHMNAFADCVVEQDLVEFCPLHFIRKRL